MRFWLNSRIILRPRSHLVLLLVNREAGGTPKPGVSEIRSSGLISFVGIKLDKNSLYIYIFSEVMLIFGFCVKGVAWLSSNFVLRAFVVRKLVRGNIIRALGGLLS